MGYQAFHQIGFAAGPFLWYVAVAALLLVPIAWARRRRFVPFSVVPALLTAGIAWLQVPMPFCMIALMLPFIATVSVAVRLGVASSSRTDSRGRLAPAALIPSLIPILTLPMWMVPIMTSSSTRQYCFLSGNELTYSGTSVGVIDRSKVQITYFRGSDSSLFRGADTPTFWTISDRGHHEFILSSDNEFYGEGHVVDGSEVAMAIAKWAGVTPEQDSPALRLKSRPTSRSQPTR